MKNQATYEPFILSGYRVLSKMKKRQLKVWPETVHYLPSVSPFQSLAGTEHDIRIDFSECRQVSSTGLTILLLQILSLLRGGNKERKWETDNIDKNPIVQIVLDLGFFSHINHYCTNASFLLEETNNAGPFEITRNNFFYGRQVDSYPILRLDFTNYKTDRRAAMKQFKKEVHSQLLKIQDSYPIHANQLTSMFYEMAKNSADHTDGDAFFGMDVVNIKENDKVELHFAFGDFGRGIKQHIQDHLPADIKIKRGPYWSLYESYLFALKHGYTSTPQNNKNRGLGMSIILDGARGVNMSLSVFDAGSRGILSSIKETTHEELRKHFIPFRKDNLFYYYGSVESEV